MPKGRASAWKDVTMRLFTKLQGKRDPVLRPEAHADRIVRRQPPGSGSNGTFAMSLVEVEHTVGTTLDRPKVRTYEPPA